jgi:quaternary ammonium compound-resistance protein SugE
MAWLNLMIAGLLEVFWAISLKYTDGFSKFWPNVTTVAHDRSLLPSAQDHPVGTGTPFDGNRRLTAIRYHPVL